MKKLVIMTCVVAALISGLVGGMVFAGTNPPGGSAPGPVWMDGGSGNLTAVDNPRATPQFASPLYPQMRHVSLTLWASGLTNPSPDEDFITVRAYFKSGQGVLVPLSIFHSDGDDWGYVRGTIEFDATRWDIIAGDFDITPGYSGFTTLFSYTTTYPSTQNRQ